MSKMKCKRLCVMLILSLLLVCMMGTTAFAAGTGDVAGAVESTWATASTQIKTVVNNVVFPAIDLILAVFFFAKLGTAYETADLRGGRILGRSRRLCWEHWVWRGTGSYAERLCQRKLYAVRPVPE